MMTEDKLTHIDVGMSMSMAHVLGEKPTIDILCGSTDGDKIRDSEIAIRIDGRVPAACSCGVCRRIAEIMHYHDCDAVRARRIYAEQLIAGGARRGQ
jgi:hypothetical protein